MKVLSMVMAILMTMGVALGSAFAGHRGTGHERAGEHGLHGGPSLLRMLDRLDLDKKQEAEIASILSNYRDRIGKTFGDMMGGRKALREAVTAEEYSDAALREAVKQLGEIELQAATLAREILNEVRPILSVEQKERLKDFGSRRAGKTKGFADRRLAELDKWIADHTQ